MSSGSSRRRRRRSRGGAPQRSPESDFWGLSSPAGDEPPAPPEKVRPTPDPAVLVRSLGDPPLGSNPALASHHLAVIYEEAVKAAIALAAANGLLEDEVAPTG